MQSKDVRRAEEDSRMQYLDPYLVGRTIRRLCVDQGITPTMIVDQLGLASVQSVYCWYSGRNVPRVDNLLLLSDLFGVSTDYILRGADFGETYQDPTEDE